MICVGTALLHPLAVEATVNDQGLKLAFDDGLDVAVSVLGAGGLGTFGAAYEAAFMEQLDQVGAQVLGLTEPGGPLAAVTSLGDLLDGHVDVAGLLERAADFLCELEPGMVSGMLAGLMGRVGAALPVLDPAELATRVRTLATAGLAALEGPLLSGRDDLQAHRSYRAAAALRHRLDPLLDGLEDLLRRADFLEAARASVDAITEVDDELLAPIRNAGCLLRDRVVPLARCAAAFQAGVSVTVGPQGQGPPPVPLEHDVLPAPHPSGHWLWVMDLVTNAVALVTVVVDSARTRNPPRRVMQLLFTDILRPAWVLTRLIVRAARPEFTRAPPGGLAGEPADGKRDFTRALFSDLGDFTMHFAIELIGSIHDMEVGWANWVSSIGLRLVKYYTLVVQPRTAYLFLRSAWYVREWSRLPEAGRPRIPTARYAWLVYGPAWALSLATGLIVGLVHWEKFSLAGGAVVGPAIAGAVAPVLSWVFVPFVRADGYGQIGPNQLESGRWEPFFALAAAVVVMVIATQTLVQSTPGPGVTAMAWTLPILFFLLAVAAAASAGAGHVIYWLLVLVIGLFMSGILTVIVWWYTLADGRDKQKVFAGIEAATSPYRLPYPEGEAWLCGQNSHGFFSHQMIDPNGVTLNVSNHYSYDFNEERGSRVVAARTGLVSQVRDGIPDGDRTIENTLQVQHLDWVEKHDPGWDEERAVSYAEYLHLAERGALVHMNQLVRQGMHIAVLDDTGISAMEHLHFSGNSGQNMAPRITGLDAAGFYPSPSGIQNVPVVFREGKPRSLSFTRSTNRLLPQEDVGRIDVAIPLADAAIPAAPPAAAPAPHGHEVRLTLGDLDPGGAIPASVTLVTEPGASTPRHRHRLDLTRAQIIELLRNRDVPGPTTSTELDHDHRVEALPKQPSRSSPSHKAPLSANNVTPAWAAPPPATLLAGAPMSPDGDYDLLGTQLMLRVNGRVTEWHTFGAHRATVPGVFTLDRGPDRHADIQIKHAGATTSPATTSHLMARAAARALSTDEVAVRAEPILVLETQRRGTAATLTLTSAPAALERLTTGTTAGTGPVPRLDAVPPATIRDVIADALTQKTRVSRTINHSLGQLEVKLGGRAVAAFTASTPRIAEAMALWAPSGSISGIGVLPLGSGLLRLTATRRLLEVPVYGTPARIAITHAQRTQARLVTGTVEKEPLVVRVRDDDQRVRFAASDTTASALAQAIMTQAEGVRAWARGSTLVIETVAAGTAAGLTLTKGTGTFPAVTPGTAPLLSGGRRLEDTTAVSLLDLVALIESAHDEASRRTAPADVTLTGGVLEIRARATADAVRVEGSDELMQALTGATAPLTGTGSVQIPGLTADLDLDVPGWLDVTVGGSAWRVDVHAEPARAELRPTRMPQASERLVVDVNGTSADVEFRAADVRSLATVADRISRVVGSATPTGDGITVRVAYRYTVEAARHGPGNLEVGDPTGTASLGTASAGLVHAADAGRKTGVVDATAVGRATAPAVPLAPGVVTGRLQRAFSLSGTPPVFSAPTGQVTIVAADADPLSPATLIDPLGVVGSPATDPGSGPFRLGRESVGYEVAAAGTTTTVEFNAAPARAATVAAIPFDPTVLEPPGPHELTVTVTGPGSASHTSVVDLGGAQTLDEAAQHIQREAPHARAWVETDRLHIASRGGGTGWQLRLEGEPVMLALGFDPAAMGADRHIVRQGSGNVANGEAVTLAEVEDVFHTMGGLATAPAISEYTVATVPGGKLAVTSTQGTVTLDSDPRALAAGLTKTPIANGIEVDAPTAITTGWLFVDVAGRRAGAAAVWGRRAAIEAPDPLAASLAAAGGARLSLEVDGRRAVRTTLPAAAIASADALLRHLNRRFGERAWFGTVTRSGAAHLRVESRIRGRRSEVKLTCTPPALGFTAATTASTDPGQLAGDGIAHDLDAVTAAELDAALAGALGRGDAPQDAFQAVHAAGKLRLVATGGPTVNLIGPGAPHPRLGTPATPRQDTLEYSVGSPVDIGPDLLTYVVNDTMAGTPPARTVRALLHAEPARLGPMRLPPALSRLDGRTLRIVTGSTPYTVTFAGVRKSIDVADQIERATGGAVRARAGRRDLLIETRVAGSSASLSVTTDPGVSTAFTVLGTPSPASAAGTGNVPDDAQVDGAGYAAVLNAGFLGRDTTVDRSSFARVTVGTRDHATFTSGRVGCASALELLPDAAAGGGFAQALVRSPLDLDLSLERGPAVRASVALRGFADGTAAGASHTLNGDLWIRFNDNAASPDLAAASDVQVTFNGTYTAREAAAAIDEVVEAAGVGTAAAYRDHVIVVETAMPGMAGTVTIPAPGATSTAAVLTALGAGTPLSNRGWPGAGVPNGRVGFRGHDQNAFGAVQWEFFITASDRTPLVAIPAGMTPADAAAAVDTALRNPVGAASRIGMAALDADGALCVELYRPAGGAGHHPLGVDTAGGAASPLPAPAAKPPDAIRLWIGADTGVEPAFELRRTDVLRTLRMVYFDRRSDAGVLIDPALFDPSPAPAADSPDRRVFDVGWVRPPTDENGVVRPIQRWMNGRWLVAARMEGARTDTGAAGARTPAYGAGTDMVLSGGSATVAGRRVNFAHQARYWVELGQPQATFVWYEEAMPAARATPLRVVRIGNDFLVDHLVL